MTSVSRTRYRSGANSARDTRRSISLLSIQALDLVRRQKPPRILIIPEDYTGMRLGGFRSHFPRPRKERAIRVSECEKASSDDYTKRSNDRFLTVIIIRRYRNLEIIIGICIPQQLNGKCNAPKLFPPYFLSIGVNSKSFNITTVRR